jgi:nucleoid-associated protein YgaU
MAKVKPVGGSINRYSWLNNCKPESLNSIMGSLKNKRRTDFWGLYTSPEIPSSDSDTIHIVAAGERIDNIAYKYYGSSMLWWVIAERNSIDLPIAELRQGMKLIIPASSVIETVLQTR